MSNALITGASRGIGAAAARLFAQEGWSVAVHYNASREAAEELATELAGLGVLTRNRRSGWSGRRRGPWGRWTPWSAMRG